MHDQESRDTTLVEKVARAMRELEAQIGPERDATCDELAKAAIAVVLKELYRKGSWLHLDRTLDLVQEMARENGVSLDE